MTEKGKVKDPQFHAAVCMILTNKKLKGDKKQITEDLYLNFKAGKN